MSALDPHTIESDLYDRATIARLRAGSLSWRRLDDEGGRLVPHFAALLDDLFCALFKYNVLALSPGASPPSSAFNRAIVERVIAGPAYQVLRHQTLLDEARAGIATVSIGEALLDALREDRVLTPGDLLDLWSLTREEQRAQEADEEAEVADELAREPLPDETEEDEELASGEAPEGGDERALGEADPSASAKRRRAPRRAESEAAERARTRVRERSRRAAQKTMAAAARAARQAARAAAGERLQKQRHVEGALTRVAQGLDQKVRAAAGRTAQDLQDLPESLAAWGRGLGASGPHDAAQSIDLGRRLCAAPKLKRLAQLFGRMRESALALRHRVLERADEELYEVGLHRSLDDLARLVPHELLALSHPLLRRDFRRRLLDGGLQTYALRGIDSRGRGPLVVCLDTSGSMAGEKETWSKAVTLTFVELARRQRRRCHVVCFADATALREFDMNPHVPYEVALDTTLDLAEHFSGGGTDFMAPLDAALAKLKTRELRRADVVLITDGECSVDPEWQEQFLRSKRRRDFSLYAILIDRGSARGDTVERLADRVTRVSDLTTDTRELFSAPRRLSRTGS